MTWLNLAYFHLLYSPADKNPFLQRAKRQFPILEFLCFCHLKLFIIVCSLRCVVYTFCSTRIVDVLFLYKNRRLERAHTEIGSAWPFRIRFNYEGRLVEVKAGDDAVE